jgi:hypothetical protein
MGPQHVASEEMSARDMAAYTRLYPNLRRIWTTPAILSEADTKTERKQSGLT